MPSIEGQFCLSGLRVAITSRYSASTIVRSSSPLLWLTQSAVSSCFRLVCPRSIQRSERPRHRSIEFSEKLHDGIRRKRIVELILLEEQDTFVTPLPNRSRTVASFPHKSGDSMPFGARYFAMVMNICPTKPSAVQSPLRSFRPNGRPA